jgi:hypothetical protein
MKSKFPISSSNNILTAVILAVIICENFAFAPRAVSNHIKVRHRRNGHAASVRAVIMPYSKRTG